MTLKRGLLSVFFLAAISLIFPNQGEAKSSFLDTLKGRLSNSSKYGQQKKNPFANVRCTFSGYDSRSAPVPEFPEDEGAVCDPLMDKSSDSSDLGLVGSLLLKNETMSSRPQSVLEYYNKGTRMSQKVYFADVNVPTQQFTKGFITKSGDVLVDGDGNKLIENFAIEYTSILKLQPSDKAGHYEFALLSDDGSRMYAKINDQWQEVINNDGNHQTRMGCALKTLYLDHTSEIPIKILYFQGARYHVANVLVWKHHKKEKSWKPRSRHSLCGSEGNDLFFNSRRQKDGLGMFILKSQGWSVVAGGNFSMPASETNPCTEEHLVVSNLQIVELGPDYAIVSWKTNKPASSQVILSVEGSPGQEYQSPLSADLVTDHVVRIDGLPGRTTYLIKAVSKDAEGNEAVSPPPPLSFDL